MQQETKQSFPLHWPVGYKRTAQRKDSAFKQTPGNVQDFLKSQLSKLGASNVIVNSNAQLQRDGSMYADAMLRHNDPGIAVYFNYKGKPVVLCCDTYTKIWENVYAIGKTIENLRAIERYGVSDFLNKSFTGFAELPEPIATPYKRDWWIVLGVPPNASETLIKEAFKIKAKMVHPDVGGSESAFNELQEAYKEALK